MDLHGVGEISPGQDDAPCNRFNFRLRLMRFIQRLMVMEEDIEPLPRQSQREDFSQPMRCAGDKGKGRHEVIINVDEGCHENFAAEGGGESTYFLK